MTGQFTERRQYITPDEARQLLHDMRCQQIELERQNEELRRTQTELDLAHKRYFDLYHLAPVGYFTLSDTGRILEANLTASALLGTPCDKLVGVRLQDVIAPADQDLYRHRRRIFGPGPAHSCELRMLRGDGSPFWVHLTATHAHGPNGEAMHRLVLTDIDARKRAQDRIRVSEVALKAISQGVLITTPDLRVISANTAIQAMTGYTERELVGSRFEVFHGALTDAATVQAVLLAIREQREFSCELLNYRKNGSSFWNEMTISPLHNDRGEVTHYISINTDISERKRNEQTMEAKNRELAAAKAMAEKANQAKSEFLSNMSHELRSPLNAILGFAQLLDGGAPPLTAQQKANVDKMLCNGWYLLTLINEILDLALIESGKLALSMGAVPMLRVLQDCLSMIGQQADSRGIRINLAQIPSSLMVHADPIRLQQVMINLLTNAIKYNRPGGVVDVRADVAANQRVHISVRDTGQGMSPEQLAQMFEPFNRLGRERSDTEGTGIGLVVTKRLTELMGGTIGVQSTLGTGSVFWVDFSQSQAPVEATGAMSAVGTGTALPALSAHPPCTVLYVEDNQANLELVRQILASRSNIRLLCAQDGVQGLEMTHVYRPQVILMDISLPGISGMDVLQILRMDPVTRHIPVLAVSANAMPQDVGKGLATGFFRYLTKPFKIPEFLEALDQAVLFALARPAPAQ